MLVVRHSASSRAKCLVGALCCALLASCGGDAAPPINLRAHYVASVQPLVGTDLPGVILNEPGQIVATERHVVVAHRDSSRRWQLLAYSLDGGDPVAVWPRPDEPSRDSLESLRSLRLSPDGQKLSIFDLTKRRITDVLLDETSKGVQFRYHRTTSLASTHLLTDPVRVSDNLILSAGFFDSGRVAGFDSSGKVVMRLGTLALTDTGIPEPVRQHAAQSRAALRPNGEILALGWFYSDRIELLNLRDSSWSAAERPFNFDSPYRSVWSGLRFTFASAPGTHYGYLSLAPTEDRIFALFSGRGGGEPGGGMPNAARLVHVYCWDGRLVEVLELDEDAHVIAVNRDATILVATRDDFNASIRLYGLRK